MDAQRRVLGLATVRALPDLVRAGLAAAGLLDARLLATLDEEDVTELEVLFGQAAGTELPPGDKLRGGGSTQPSTAMSTSTTVGRFPSLSTWRCRLQHLRPGGGMTSPSTSEERRAEPWQGNRSTPNS